MWEQVDSIFMRVAEITYAKVKAEKAKIAKIAKMKSSKKGL